MTLLELFEPLLWMMTTWSLGIATGLGLGTALASQRFQKCLMEDQ